MSKDTIDKTLLLHPWEKNGELFDDLRKEVAELKTIIEAGRRGERIVEKFLEEHNLVDKWLDFKTKYNKEV